MWADDKKKVVTFSYDDGFIHDVRLVEMFNRHGLKCTFNLNSGLMGKASRRLMYEGKPAERINSQNAIKIYKGHEIAAHFLTHARFLEVSREQLETEIVQDIKNLSELFGCDIVGMAYPFGQYSDALIDILRENGIKYARTVEASHSFEIKNDLMRLHPTCKHNDKKLFELAEYFVNATPAEPMLFYVWGHSFDFDCESDWDMMEEFCKYISGRGDIFYGTNREVLNL